MFTCGHVLEDQVMKDIILGKGQMLKFFAPKSFKTWTAKSWISSAIIVKTWGHGVAKKCNISRHGILPSLKKNVRFQNCGGCQVLTIMFTCVHVLEGQVMKGIILGKGLMLKFFAPKGFKTWKAKSWIVQSLSRLRDMELQKDAAVQDLVSDLWLPSLDNHFHLCSCLGRQSHERHESYLYCWNSISQKKIKTWKAKSWVGQSLSRLGDMELPKNVTFQDLADQVLKEKCKISDLLLPSLDNHVHLWSRLAKPSHESSYLSLTFKFFTPKSLKTWKAKSWIVQPLSRLGDMELQKCSV